MAVVFEDVTDQPEATPTSTESEPPKTDSITYSDAPIVIPDPSGDVPEECEANAASSSEQELYTAALEVAPAEATQRAVYHCNRAACSLRLARHAEVVTDCSHALELDPTYGKALMRRAAAYEALDDLEHALLDFDKAVELDAGNSAAGAAAARLRPVVEERREKLKDEMLGKLKELGNTVLGKFGMSLDNFKAEKDPATGSYSIKFGQ
ncbi:hypothetical protein APUTEX25_000162 [Auxenochlorella protothecoides]|uniref:Uncharacterized protein n=1 Tax=Auxenochlorella protothecoides TaxID=3075 RepID=A0A3M7L082_AUXPR|nr:hypothetical protein APUTEX25_000162 [Auxenochlorella protothecoides]|eukprot:RMZ55579.1 hypothetical protein APUTEX25_000162 [Auxenochlorella protothecoides]